MNRFVLFMLLQAMEYLARALTDKHKGNADYCDVMIDIDLRVRLGTHSMNIT